MNFGTLLQSVTASCVEQALSDKEQDAKMLAKTFIKFVNIKEILKKQFEVFSSINSSYISDRRVAEGYVNHVLSAIDGFEFKDMLSYNSLLESKCNSVCRIKKIKPSQIDIDIENMIKYRTNNRSIDPMVCAESFDRILQHITKIRAEKGPLSGLNEYMANSELKFLAPKHVVRIALNRFNKEYSDKMDIQDKKMFYLLRENDEEKIKESHSMLIKEATQLSESLSCGEDVSLMKKTKEAITKCGEEVTSDSVLDIYELVCELRKLNNTKKDV